jgi:hypothetical protein
MNIRGPGRIFDRGEVIRFISAAARPANRTMATMSDPRQILPREVPVARWTAAVVTSSASDLVSSLFVSFDSQEIRGAYRWKYHSPMTPATATLPTPLTTPQVQSQARETSAMSHPAYGRMWNTQVLSRLDISFSPVLWTI